MDANQLLQNANQNEELQQERNHNSIQEEQAYAVENAELLNRSENASSMENQIRVEKRGEFVREARRRTTVASILNEAVNEREDSQEMQEVKRSYAALKESYSHKIGANGDLDNALEEMDQRYAEAIAACQYYCDHKHPFFPKGRERKAAVEGTLKILKGEFAALSKLRERIDSGDLHEEEATQGRLLFDLICETQNTMGRVEKDPIEELALDDFERLLGARSKDAFVFRDGKLRVVKGSVRAGDDGIVSVDNARMLERLTSLLIERIERTHPMREKERINMRMQIKTNLGGSLLDVRGGALSVQGLRNLFSKVSHMDAEVDGILSGEVEEKTVHDRAIATKVNAYLPSDASEDAIERMIREGKESFQVPTLATKDYRKLATMRLPELRDSLLDTLRTLCGQMDNLQHGDGDAADYNDLLNNTEVLNKITCLLASRMSAVTKEGRAAIDYQLQSYVKELALETSPNQDVVGIYRKTAFQTLSGADGALRRGYAQKLGRMQEAYTKEESEQLARGRQDLDTLGAYLRDMNKLREKGLSDGLDEEEAGALKAVAAKLQTLGENLSRMNDMDFAAGEISSEAAEEFARFQNLVEEGLLDDLTSYADAVTKSLAKEEEEQIVRENPKVLAFQDKNPSITMEKAAEALSKFSGSEKNVVSMLLLKKNPSALIRNAGDESANQLAALCYCMRDLQNGFRWGQVKLGDTLLVFESTENDELSVRIGKQKVALPYPAGYLANRIELDIAANPQSYGDALAADVLEEKLSNLEDAFDENSRTLIANVISAKCNLKGSQLVNIPLERLAYYARYLLRGELSASDMQALAESWDKVSGTKLATTEALDLMRSYEEQKKRELARGEAAKVEVKKQEKQENPEDWSEEEREIVDLIGDLIFSRGEWKTENTEEKLPKGERLRKVLLDNRKVLSRMIANYDTCAKVLEKYQLPGVDSTELKDALGLAFDIFHVDEEGWKKADEEYNQKSFLEKVKDGPQHLADLQRRNALRSLKDMSEEEREAALQYLLGNASAQEEARKKIKEPAALDAFRAQLKIGITMGEEQLDSMTKQTILTIQDGITSQMGALFGKEVDDKDDDDEEDLEDLGKMMVSNMRGDQGQGKFLKLVMSNYFKTMSPVDQRMMIASALRNVKPTDAEKEKNLKGYERQKLIDQRYGAFIGGLLKGAGPLMHKVLQGLPTQGMSEALRKAVNETKSKLSPINPEYVEARMAKLVADSGGAIAKLEVVKSLGAASVGQAFLCRIYGPNLAKGGEEAVIKLLRPDAQNRMARERDFMIRMAKLTDGENGELKEGGMYKTYLGQLASIEREFDLRIEAANVEQGQVYSEDKGPVKSMELYKTVAPTADAMILKKAEGQTVDSYLEETSRRYAHIRFGTGERHDGRYEMQKKLRALRADLMKRQEFLAELSKRWIEEGIYKSGFYHGDLHAGNIMIDDKMATVIDFGNAMKIEKRGDVEPQTCIMHMMCAAATSHGEMFTKYFVELLGKSSEQEKQAAREALGPTFMHVLCMDGDPGLRIAVALSEAQRLGFELPPEIHNFSQCEIRLQNTLAAVKEQILEINGKIKTLNENMRGSIADNERTDPFARLVKDVKTEYIDSRMKAKKGNPDPQSAQEFVHKKFFESTDAFNEAEVREQLRGIGAPTAIGKMAVPFSVVTAIKIATGTLSSQGEFVNSLRNQPDTDDKKLFLESYEVVIDTQMKACAKEVINQLGADEEKVQAIVQEVREYLHSGKEIRREELAPILDKFAQVKTDGEYGDLAVRILKHHRMQERKEPKEEMDKLMDGIMVDAKRIRKQEADEKPSPAVQFTEQLIAAVKGEEKLEHSYDQPLEQLMHYWFEEVENHGAELRASFDRLKEMAAQGQELNADTKEVKTFLAVLEQAMVGRVLELERQAKEDAKGTYQTIPDLNTVIAKIASDRMFATIRLLGSDGTVYYNENTEGVAAEAAAKEERRTKARQDAAGYVLEDLGLAEYTRETFEKLFLPYRDYQKEPTEEKKLAIIGAIADRVTAYETIQKSPAYRELAQKYPRKFAQVRGRMDGIVTNMSKFAINQSPIAMEQAVAVLFVSVYEHNIELLRGQKGRDLSKYGDIERFREIKERTNPAKKAKAADQ